MATSSAGRHPVVTTLLVVLGLLVVGGGIAYLATDHGKALLPSLEQPTLRIRNITREQIKGQFLVKLRNHTPIDLTIDSVSYTARVDGRRLAQGHQASPLVVKGNAFSSLSLPLQLNLPQLSRTAKAAQRDCVTVQLHTILYADLPGVGPKQLPVDVRQRVYIPKLPKIEVAEVDITKLGLKKGEAIVTLRVTNYEPIPFTVKQVSYRFQVADDLDVKGQETKAVTFQKKGTQLMPIHVKFQPKSMPKVLFKTIFKPKKTDYKLTGSATVAAGPASARDATMEFNSSGTVKELKELAKGDKKK
jgi:LEA14-like dessication related protein